MKQDAINALNELADEARCNGNTACWVARRVELIKAVLEQSSVEPTLLNTCLAFDKQEPAQAVPVGEVVWIDPQIQPPDTKPHKIIDASLSFIDTAPIGTKVYTHPAPLDSDTRKMVLEFVRWIASLKAGGLIQARANDLLRLLEENE